MFFFILGILGVAPSNLSSYKPNLMGLFACLSGELSISWASVNDDYCDCPDGSDEPGTGACPNTRWTHQARDKLNYSKIDQIEVAAEQATFFAVSWMESKFITVGPPQLCIYYPCQFTGTQLYSWEERHCGSKLFLTKLTVHNTDTGNSNQRSGTQWIHHPFYSDSLLTL